MVEEFALLLVFLCAVSFFQPEKSLPVLLGILGAGHFLVYFAVRNVKYSEKNMNRTSIIATETIPNRTEPEG